MPNPNLADVLTRKYQVALKGAITPRLLSRIAGNTVKNMHDAMIARGDAPAVFQRFVNGNLNAPETSIDLSLEGKRTGTIVYRGIGASLSAAATYALKSAQETSPRDSGAYSLAWIVIVDGSVVGDPTRIPPSAEEVMIANFAPYAERMEMSFGLKGGHWTSRSRRRTRGGRPQYMVSVLVAEAVRAHFVGLDVRRQFISLPSFSHGGWDVPYVRRRPPGGTILYPAVVIRARD